LEEHARLFADPRDAQGTADLLGRAVADTLASAATAAARELLADSGDVDLTADVMWDGTRFRIVLSESSIGGLGLLEQLMTRYARNPRAFWDKVSAVVSPSEYEEVDRVLRAAIEDMLDPNGSLGPAADAFLKAGSAEQSRNTLSQLIETWTSLLGPPNHLEVSAFAVRLLRPGADQDTAELIRSLILRWDELEHDLGVEVDIRTLAYLVARGHLGFAARQHPADKVLSLLWLRGARSRGLRLQQWNPYRANEIVERLVLESIAATSVPEVDITQPSWQDTYADLLEVSGEVELIAPFNRRGDMARAIREVTAIAVEKGALRVFGRVVKCSQRLGTTRVRVTITEEYQ
jgi:hypothetical protein